MTVAIDGFSFGGASYGLSRPDVCNAYPNRPGCPNVGWSLTINTAELANGIHTLAVTAFTTDAIPRQTTARRVFTTSNSSVNTYGQSRTYIEVPAWQGTYFGTQTLAGWAIDSTSAIAAVNISIDGVSYGPAQYGLSRPDVCSALGNDPGSPYVGWNFPFDTSLLDDGPHSMTITAITTDSRMSTAMITFSTANETGPNLYVDQPAAGNSYSGQQSISGWAIDSENRIGTVSIAIDGNAFGIASYGISRQDVCNVYGNLPGCPNVGWSFPLNTAELTNGTHSLTVTAFTASTDSEPATWSVSFSTNNSNPAAQQQSRVYIEAPAAGVSWAGTQTIFGWAIDDTASIGSLSIAIDGIAYGNATYGSYRPDVCNAYPNRPGCPNVGWGFSFDTAELDDGTHTLTVTAFTTDSVPRRTTSTTSFSTRNSQISEWRGRKTSLDAGLQVSATF